MHFLMHWHKPSIIIRCDIYEIFLSRMLHYCQLKWWLVYLHFSPLQILPVQRNIFFSIRSFISAKILFPTVYFCKCWLAVLKGKKKKKEKRKKGGQNTVCTLLFRKGSGIIFRAFSFFSRNISFV